MHRAPFWPLAPFAVVLSGCPFAMNDDYVVERTVVVEPPVPVVDAGVPGVDDAGAPATDAPTCVPTTCQKLDAQCGTIADGCGGMLDCGACKEDQVCGLNRPNHCDKGREGGH
jgi:hypothetical protein